MGGGLQREGPVCIHDVDTHVLTFISAVSLSTPYICAYPPVPVIDDGSRTPGPERLGLVDGSSVSKVGSGNAENDGEQRKRPSTNDHEQTRAKDQEESDEEEQPGLADSDSDDEKKKTRGEPLRTNKWSKKRYAGSFKGVGVAKTTRKRMSM